MADADANDPLIRKLEAYGPLDDADRALLRRISATARPVPAKTDLISEGEPPAGVVVVLEGFACRYKVRANGSRQIMAYLVPGDACDIDVALLTRMDHSIGTLSPCRVARVTPEAIAKLLQSPALARALRRSTLVDEATSREWLVNVGRRMASERLAHLFCELLVRLRLVGMTGENAFTLPVTQLDLADTTGMTNVHVNRSLMELKRRGLIALGQHQLTILDLPRLQGHAEFRSNYLHLDNREAA